jgi:AcrR family transcriptional regulator
MSGNGTKETRERLLDAAERVFAAGGFGASLREITGEAGANVAAVSYHFGGKEGLIRAVFGRRMEKVNRDRLHLLDEVEAAAGAGLPSLEGILNAFISPTFDMCREHPEFMRLAGRIHQETSERRIEIFADCRMAQITSRFRAALIAALPEADVGEMWWGMAFCLGAMIHTWISHQEFEHYSQGEATYGSDETMVERLVRYCAAGLRATPRGATPRSATPRGAKAGGAA